MIYIRGDVHADFGQLVEAKNSNGENIGNGDTLIVCGDFGIWSDSEQENEMFDILEKMPYKICFIDGNHENFNILEGLKEEEWNGGFVHRIRNNIFHLMRGYIFNIEGISFFTMGGAKSHDIGGGVLDMSSPNFMFDIKHKIKTGVQFRIKNKSWWEQEIPSDIELKRGMDTLIANNNKVDVILTHCACNTIIGKINSTYGCDKLTDYLEYIFNNIEYKAWFFGHYHGERIVHGNNYLVYKDCILVDKIISQ